MKPTLAISAEIAESMKASGYFRALGIVVYSKAESGLEVRQVAI